MHSSTFFHPYSPVFTQNKTHITCYISRSYTADDVENLPKFPNGYPVTVTVIDDDGIPVIASMFIKVGALSLSILFINHVHSLECTMVSLF